MRKLHCPLSVLLAILHQVSAIVAGPGRDLVLTPKQQLQLNGKRLYYEEQPLAAANSAADRSWEHTLKHVTYVTLFTDAAVGAAAGNLSQLHDYHDFLQTPFVPATSQAHAAPQSRFGDIVTLATGRLEQLQSNGSYRFVEGSAEPSSAEHGIQTRALWRVQRIRHRDGDTQQQQQQPHRYHYEMKFSVSPLTPSIGWPPHSFIQKEADYPQSFSRVVYEEKREQAFAQRRQDRQPQATFVRGIFQPPPPPPPPLTNLNIGEYLKGVGAAEAAHSKGSPKIELFPGLFNLGLRPNFIPATTFRPSYPLKFGPRPELITPVERYPLSNELSSSGGAGGGGGSVATGAAVGAPVTHHFHHHFYMNDATNHAQLGYRTPSYVTDLSTQPTTTPVPVPIPSHQHHEDDHHEVQFPTNHASSSSTESLETGDDLHDDQQSYVRPPQLYTVYKQASKYHTSKLAPLLIYAGSGADAGDEQKTFVRSEPLEETVYRYSEPDPLYVHQHPVDVLQLETPHGNESDEPSRQTHHEAVSDEAEEQEDQQRRQTDAETEQRPAGSQKLPNVAATPAPPPAQPTTATATSTSTPKPTPTTTAGAAVTAAPVGLASKASFVSTSTSTTPLRALSRYRTTPRITAGRSTTTTTTSTEPPSFSKWKQRRKENATTNLDSKAKSSHRHESKVAFSTTTELPPTLPATNTISSSSSTTISTTTSSSSPGSSTEPATSTPAPKAATGGEVIEVLTQKSVSKSVSIKVGKNGEEIPIIVDDDENEVKRS